MKYTNYTYRAMLFAKEAHRGQVRKYTGQPYVVHPMEVAEIVSTVTDDEDMLAAALLHDTVEDTAVTMIEIYKRFNYRTGFLVYYLTDISKPEDGNREHRKLLDRIHIASAPADAKTLKLADLISNTRSIVQYDPHFAKTYMKEKRDLLPVLTQGDKRLWDIANKITEDYFKSA